jgi:GntR family transcriptional repressor for pyruvate dehydrogenase complex
MAVLKVGRSTIREALRGLALLGVVEVRQGQGNFVASTPPNTGTAQGLAAILANSTTRDLLEARRLVEVQVARIAADRRTDEDLREMQSLLERDAAHISSTSTEARHSPSFHLALCRATQNKVVEGFVQSYRSVLAQRAPSLAAIPGYLQWELGDHSRILQAVGNRDVEQAGKTMQDHLIQVEELYARVLRTETPAFWPLPSGDITF